MGNSCSCIDDLVFEYSKDIYGKVKCCKCQDRFKPMHGCKSERTPCRYHTYVLKNNTIYCIDCNRTKEQIKSRNCYHLY